MRNAPFAFFAALTLAFFVWAPIDAVAQQRIPPNIISSSSTPQGPAKQAIIDYANFYANQLATGTDAQISEARKALLDPIKKVGSTAAFKKAYSGALSQQLQANAMSSDNVKVRLNAIIVIKDLTDTAAGEAALKALADDDTPAVRYWAAHAVAEMAKAQTITEQQLRDSLPTMGKIAGDEYAQEVLEKIFLAMIEMDVVEAREELLSSLNNRLKFHVGRDAEPFRAEQSAIFKLHGKLVRNRLDGKPVDSQLKELSRICARYLALIGDQLVKNARSMPTADVEDRKAILSSCDSFLQYTFDQFKPAANKPKKLDQAIKFNKWREIQLAASDWKKVLQLAPYSIPPERLNIIDE